jgi:hypothetical protein
MSRLGDVLLPRGRVGKQIRNSKLNRGHIVLTPASIDLLLKNRRWTTTPSGKLKDFKRTRIKRMNLVDDVCECFTSDDCRRSGLQGEQAAGPLLRENILAGPTNYCRRRLEVAPLPSSTSSWGIDRIRQTGNTLKYPNDPWRVIQRS